MHQIEPFWQWRNKYTAENDPLSPFYGRTYSELHYSDTIYNYYIHPQWDFIESPSLYIKILFANYTENFCIIELLGEWNDAIQNDIMLLKQEVIDVLMENNIYKFVLIGENVLNFHADTDDYYAEWYNELISEGGWVALLNFREHILTEMENHQLLLYLESNEWFQQINWRTLAPAQIVELIEEILLRQLR